MVNELLVGFSHTTVTRETYDWAGHRRRQRPLRHRRRPADRRAQLRSAAGSGLTAPGADRPRLGHAGQDLPDQREAHLAQGPPHPQVRRPVAALRPAALLRRQQRPARLHQLQRRLHRLRRSPTSCSTWSSGKGRGGGDPDDPWTHLQNRIGALRPGRLQAHAEPHAERRAALGLHLAAGREGQPAVELRPASTGAADLRRATAASRTARSTSPYYKGFEPRLGVAWSVERPPGAARRLRHLAVHGRHRRQPAAAAQPAVLLRVGRRPTTAPPAPASVATRLRRPRPGHDARRQRARLRSRTCGRSSRSSGTRSSSTR